MPRRREMIDKQSTGEFHFTITDTALARFSVNELKVIEQLVSGRVTSRQVAMNLSRGKATISGYLHQLYEIHENEDWENSDVKEKKARFFLWLIQEGFVAVQKKDEVADTKLSHLGKKVNLVLSEEAGRFLTVAEQGIIECILHGRTTAPQIAEYKVKSPITVRRQLEKLRDNFLPNYSETEQLRYNLNLIIRLIELGIIVAVPVSQRRENV